MLILGHVSLPHRSVAITKAQRFEATWIPVATTFASQMRACMY